MKINDYKILFSVLIILLPIGIGFSIKNADQLRRIPPPPKTQWKVSVTMYNVDPRQTDSSPNITASGFEIDTLNPEKHRIIAVSHDLKRYFVYGERVILDGVGKWSGIYYVRDLMNKRWRNKVDILVSDSDKPRSFNSATLHKIKK